MEILIIYMHVNPLYKANGLYLRTTSIEIWSELFSFFTVFHLIEISHFSIQYSFGPKVGRSQYSKNRLIFGRLSVKKDTKISKKTGKTTNLWPTTVLVFNYIIGTSDVGDLKLLTIRDVDDIMQSIKP